MRQLRDTLGSQVVARDTAEPVGDVLGAVVDVGSRHIAALQVGKGHKARLADWSSLSGVGPDATVVESEGALRPPNGEREERVVKGDIALLGGLVLTDRGDALGRLDDVEFDETTGELVALVCGDISVSADRLRSIGSYAVVVGADDGAGAP